MKARELDEEEIEQWVMNDEGLYNWWRGSKLPLSRFVHENRTVLTQAIRPVLEGTKPAHYLTYGGNR